MTNKERMDLADLVRKVMVEKDLVELDIQTRSGNQIKRTTINDILNRRHENLTIEKLKALAKGLGLPVKYVLTVAAGGDPTSDEDFLKDRMYMLYELYEDSDNEVRKRMAAEFIDMLIEDFNRDKQKKRNNC